MYNGSPWLSLDNWLVPGDFSTPASPDQGETLRVEGGEEENIVLEARQTCHLLQFTCPRWVE